MRATPAIRSFAAALLVASLGLDFAVRATDTTPTKTVTPVPAYRQADRVAVLTVEGEIDMVTLWSLERRVERAVSDGAEAIVFEIDTPGGRVDAALDICHLIKTDTPANSVAWINPQAYSAGTIIALSCREIVVSPHARFGDAAPIQIVGGALSPLPPAERAKAESPILEEVTTAARRNGYDEKLLQAFVSVGIELWLIENSSTGERAVVDRAEYEALFGSAPSDEITPISPGGADATRATKVVPWYGTTIPIPPAGVDAGSPAKERPPVRSRFTEADRGTWRPVSQIVPRDRLLTISEAEAIHYGIAVATIRNEEELRAYFGADTVVRYDESWSESLVRFLISWPVRIVLIVVFVVGLFLEMAAPGVGAFGATAALALVALIGAPYLVGMAQWWEIALIASGLLLIGVEIFLVPGLGAAGFAGILCLLVGLVGTFISGDISTAAGQTELATGLGATVTAVFAAVVAIWLIGRNLNELPVFDRLVLRAELGRGSQSESATQGRRPAPHAAIDVGQVGTAETDLRPSGRAMFDGRGADVVSVGGYIDRGRPVRVISVGRFSIEVEEHRA